MHDAGVTTPQSVIVRVAPGQAAAVKANLAARGAAILAEHPSINAVTARLTGADVDALGTQIGVLTMSLDTPVRSFAVLGGSASTAVSIVRTTQGLTPTSPTGRGVGVAVIDSGIQPTADVNGRIIAFFDYVKLGGAPPRRTTTTATARTSPA